MLPRTLDATWDIMELLSEIKTDNENLAIMVLDFKDAFWQIPLLPEEMPFVVGKLGSSFFLFRRAPQGSRGAPLLWARTVALLTRLTHAMHPCGKFRASVYVDDPLIVVSGTFKQRMRKLVKTAVALTCLGFDMAFNKTELAEIGASYHLDLGHLHDPARWSGC